MSEIEPLMTLKTKADGQLDATIDAPGQQPPSAQLQPSRDSLPLLGLFAVGFGLLGIFTFAPVFVPLALILGLIAIFAGQIMLGLSAVVLSLVGIISSTTLMVILGAGAFLAWIGIPFPF